MRDIPKITPRSIGSDLEIFSIFYEVPIFGGIPVNSFLLRAQQPVLVDTGFVAGADAYLDALKSRIDLRDLRWIWLSHADPDHVGSLRAVLDAAPQAKLVTTFLGLGHLGLSGDLPPERVHLLNPGQRLDVGDRDLLAVHPCVYDSPETTGFLDTKTRVLFSADQMGAVLDGPALNAADIPTKALRDGVVLWATVDAPWLAGIREEAFDADLKKLHDLAPTAVLSSHLPPAFGMLDTLIDYLRAARTAPPFVGPDQAELMKALATPPPAAPEVHA